MYKYTPGCFCPAHGGDYLTLRTVADFCGVDVPSPQQVESRLGSHVDGLRGSTSARCLSLITLEY